MMMMMTYLRILYHSPLYMYFKATFLCKYGGFFLSVPCTVTCITGMEGQLQASIFLFFFPSSDDMNALRPPTLFRFFFHI